MERDFDPKLTWNSSRDDVIGEFYKPALLDCELYQRLAGYFSSSTFANIANEILEFIESNGRIQLITSPRLSETDKKIFEQSVNEGEKFLSIVFLKDLKDDPDHLKLEFSKLMAYMLGNYIDGKPQLEIKIAIPSTGPGIYHQKIGILRYKNGEKIVFAGSVNETGLGWYENIENFTVFRSWGDDTNNQGIIDNQRDFNDLWNNSNNEVRVYDLPRAVREHLLKIRPESSKELEVVLDKIRQLIRDKKTPSIPSFSKPDIKLQEHQIMAIDKWAENNFCGLLEMATGTGKTFTAFGCINKIQKLHERTMVIIACPQLHLVEQWKSEMEKWNLSVNNSEKILIDSQVTCYSDNPKWRIELQRILYDFNTPLLGSDIHISNHIVVFVTHNTLALSDFTGKILETKNAKKCLIIDEVHNITEKSSHKTLLEDFDLRLGLSATPTRHLDDVGTEILKEYFHGIVYVLNLEKAIHELHILCTYEYFPYYVPLIPDEMKIYQKLTSQIAQIEEQKKKGTYNPKKGDYNPYLRRADLIANAENKYGTLETILDEEFNNVLADTLIYCTNNPSPASPNSPRQLERVQNILSNNDIVSDSVTWVDKTQDRLHILTLMETGHFDCITAIGCLDEGVDIPSVRIGIFMASSGNPKQFIQRRGRILRKSEKTGKTSAAIYDILVTPPIPNESTSLSLSERKLMAKELLRHKEFALIANNKKEAIQRIKKITETFNIDFDALSYDYVRDMN